MCSVQKVIFIAIAIIIPDSTNAYQVLGENGFNTSVPGLTLPGLTKMKQVLKKYIIEQSTMSGMVWQFNCQLSHISTSNIYLNL